MQLITKETKKYYQQITDNIIKDKLGILNEIKDNYEENTNINLSKNDGNNV